MTTPRLGWLDTARGMAVTLVVLYHAVLSAESVSGIGGAWLPFISFFQPLRLPLLFFVSGILSASAIDRSWRWLARNRVGTLLWCYGLWTALTFLVFWFVPYTRPEAPGRGMLPMMESLVLPHTGLWYLLSLAVMVVAAKALRRVPAWLVLPASGVLSAALVADAFGAGLWWSWANTLSYAFFFFLGLEFRGPAIRLVEAHSRPRPTALAAAGYVVAVGLAAYFGLQGLPGVRLVISVLAIAAALLVAAQISGKSWAAWLTRIGAMTLPIYVSHEIVIGVLAAAIQPFGASISGVGFGLPVAFAAVAVVTGIWLNSMLARVPGIFRTPWTTTPVPWRVADPAPGA